MGGEGGIKPNLRSRLQLLDNPSDQITHSTCVHGVAGPTLLIHSSTLGTPSVPVSGVTHYHTISTMYTISTLSHESPKVRVDLLGGLQVIAAIGPQPCPLLCYYGNTCTHTSMGDDVTCTWLACKTCRSCKPSNELPPLVTVSNVFILLVVIHS